jgi:hypothetical protein
MTLEEKKHLALKFLSILGTPDTPTPSKTLQRTT